MDKEKILEDAIKSGEILRVRYDGGSQAGAAREISPIQIFNGKVRARCLCSNAVKHFFIDKLHILEWDDSVCKKWEQKSKLGSFYSSIDLLYEKELIRLQEWGWVVNSERDVISLHRRFKNGNPRKGSDVKLSYEEFRYDSMDSWDDEVVVRKIRRSRPFLVQSKNICTSYGTLMRAAEKFLEEAKILSPSKMVEKGD